jgi:hypothetical protein
MSAVGISAATLTGAGFSAGTTGASLKSGGTDYTLSINALQIVVTLFTEAEPGGQTTTFAGVVYVYQNGDVSAADFTSAAAKLATIGLSAFKAGVPQANVTFGGAGVAGLNGTIVAFSQSF